MENSFCPNCGASVTNEEKFCQSCGTTLASQSGKFSGLQNFQAPTQSPVMQQPVQPWEGGSLMNTTTDFVVRPAEAAPAVLQAPNSPSTIVFVALAGVLTGILSYLIQLKTDIVIGSSIDDQAVADALLATKPNIITLMISSLIGIFITWFIGSWLLSLFEKGGFPLNHPLRYDAFPAMRKLNGYRHIPVILALIIQTLLLLASPNQTAVYELQELPFLGVPAPLPTYSGFGSLYTIGSIVTAIIFNIWGLYILYKAITANKYQGVAFYLVLAIMFYSNVISPVLSLLG